MKTTPTIIKEEEGQKRSTATHTAASAASFRVHRQCVSVVHRRRPADTLLPPFLENNVVDKFNKCAVSNMTCVPQKKDDSSCPVPPREKLVQSFNTKHDAMQDFVQYPDNPAHLINHDNNYLHYRDDWFILGYAVNDNKEGTPPFAFV